MNLACTDDRVEQRFGLRVVAPTVGVTAVLNFAPVKVFAPKDVIVRQVDLSSELMFLSFYLDREQV